MAAGDKLVLKITSAVAAAVVTAKNLSEALRETVRTDQKFVVHPHIARVSNSDSLLHGYLRSIYTGRRSLGAEYPEGAYSRLAETATLETATTDLATALAIQMSKRNANAGILFGFILEVADSDKAHGVIKADLDDEQRFHFQAAGGNTWSIDAVRELLPPPRAEYAKFAIAPQPAGNAAVGVHDVTNTASAADYFLTALGLTVPREHGTQALLAKAALEAGYAHDVVKSALGNLDRDRPVEEFINEVFPKIPQRKRETLRGSPNRPMPSVRADDPYVSVYKTRNPHFRLEADQSVDVKVNGRVLTVTLPEGSDALEYKARG